MKFTLILIILLMSSPIFALPCPNGNGLLYKGDLIDDVIKTCGEPLIRNTNIRTLYTLQEWSYYIKHAYDPGYSEMLVSFRNGQVIRIRVVDHFWLPVCRPVMIQFGAATTVQNGCTNVYDPMFTNLCGLTFQTGASTDTVEAICGTPAAQTKNVYKIEQTELKYGRGVQQTIIFQNGKLIDWK